MFTETEKQLQVLEPELAATACSRIKTTVTRFLDGSRCISANDASSLPQFQRNELVLGRLLGSGGFSKAYELKSIDLCDEVNRTFSSRERKLRSSSANKASQRVKGSYQYAVKHIQPKFLANPNKFKDAGADIIVEAHFLASLNHPNILSIKGWAKGGPNAYSGGEHDGFFIVLERLHETLDQRIKRWDTQLKRYRQPILEKIAKNGEMQQLLFSGRLKVARDIASALSYLHSKGIIYRDMKPSNIGFDMEGIVRIFDFGLSREMPKEHCVMNETFQMSGKVGTVRYMANEVCRSEPYNQKADVYSLTMVLWEMLALEKPFKTFTRSMHRELVVDGGERPEIDPSWPQGVQTLLHCGWSSHISVRPTMAEFHLALVQEIMELQVPSDERESFRSGNWHATLPVESTEHKTGKNDYSQRSMRTADTMSPSVSTH